jgi:uncharacterized protein YecT (DUF1311 family)
MVTMGFSRFLFLSTVFFISINCRAQTEETEDPIDREYKTCIGNDTSSSTISNCAYIAYGKWESELERYYSRIMKALSKPADKTAFKQSEDAWVAFQNAEFGSFNHMFNIPGNKWYLLRLNSRIDVLKTRVLQLRQYYDTIEGSKELFDRKK